MKVIGYIKPEYNDEGEVVNGDYVNGGLVALSESELSVLGLLQSAWDGETFRAYINMRDTDNRMLSDAFKAVRCFVEAKFALNEFKNSINNLDDVLMGKSE
jgi:hypothetical protein